MQTTPAKRRDYVTLAAFIVSVLLGGNNAIAVRFSNAELPPFFGAGIRFAAAAALLFVAVAALRLPFPRGRSLLGALVYGSLAFGLCYALIYWSLMRVAPGLFQVVLALAPLLTFGLAMLHGQERFRWRVLAGGLMALAGIAVVFRDQLSARVPLAALLAIIGAAACVAEGHIIAKVTPASHPVTTNAVAMAAGAAILLGMAWVAHERPSVPVLPTTWAAVAYVVLAGSVGLFGLNLYVLKRWTASATTYALVLVPIQTVLVSAWLTHERITAGLVAGGALVLLGVYIGASAPTAAAHPRDARPPSARPALSGDK